MGASLGTAMLSTIAVAVTSHAVDPHTLAAISRGYAVAAACAAGVLLAGALFVAFYLRGSRFIDYTNGGRQSPASSGMLEPEV